MRGWIWTLAALAGSVPAAAQTIDMPVAKGFWINVTDKCGTASNGYAFDGARWDAVYFYGPGGGMGPAVELDAITQTRPVEGIQVIDDTLVRCGMAALSPKMQAALRRAAPGLVVR